MINITDSKGRWRLTSGAIENRKTGEVRSINVPPNVHQQAAHISEEEFARKCAVAFQTGTWV